MTATVASTAGRPGLKPIHGIGDGAGQAGQAALDGLAGEVYRVHAPDLLRFARKLTFGDVQGAEDIVQETLLRAWRHPEVLEAGAERIRPWLFTVLKRVAIDMWRTSSDRGQKITGEWPADVPEPDDRIEQAITAVDVRAALATLSTKHRQVIFEMYYRNRSAAEVADALGIPIGTVKSRTYYALRTLRRAMRDFGHADQPPSAPPRDSRQRPVPPLPLRCPAA
jgi:RNA polymerase sigma-70 factor (ECF subfamily)